MINLNHKDNDASFALDLLRAAAAQAVCVGHAIGFFQIAWLRPPAMPVLQNIGVCIFFVLSGFLIAYTLVTRSRSPDYHFANYAIDRIARIYSGWVPALLFVLSVDSMLIWAGVYDRYASFTVHAFFGNLFMVQNYFGLFEPHIAVRVFGSGGPFWTLAIECHIYAFVGALFFLATRQRHWFIAVVAVLSCQLPLHYLTGSRGGNDGTGLFTLWLAGFALPFLIDRYARVVPTWLCIVAALGAFAIYYVDVTRPGDGYEMAQYPWLIIGFAAYIAIALRSHLTVAASWPKIVRFAADYSFTLYLIHYTVLYAISRFVGAGNILWMLAGIAAANLIAIPIAIFTEMKHKQFGRYLAERYAFIQFRHTDTA
jgi:peptidoglycan/LPS O-acetylase OafA/YrhL